MSESKKVATLFVRNLHAKTTSADLEAHFGAIGPIRRCFVVTDAGSLTCKGFGFVHYALAEDADSAIKTLNRSLLHGRKLSLDLAKPRLRSGGRDGTEADADGGLPKKRPRVASAPQSAALDDEAVAAKKTALLVGSLAMRTVVLSSTEKGAAISEEEARDAVGADEKGSKFESCALTADGTEARCVFTTWPKAGKAAVRAHGDKFSAVIEALKGGKRTRLIVRNLPFIISPAQLRETCEKVAPVRDLSLAPANVLKIESEKLKHPSDDAVACGGYAFVEYFLVSDAKYAMSKLNGSKIGNRTVAVDMAIGKKSYVAQTEADEEVNEPDDNGSENESGSNSDSGSEDDSSDESGSEDDNESVENEGSEIQEDDAQEIEEISKDGDETKAAPSTKPAASTEDELTRTVFIRNLLFETSASELWKAMAEKFGPVEQAVLVSNPVTGRPRGTAFVRFVDSAHAVKAVTIAGQGDVRNGKSTAKQNIGFMLQGRPLMISKAVDRTKVKEVVESSTSKNQKDEDPRNLRLSFVGMIKAGTPEARGLSQDELDRRAKAAKAKKEKLAHNPNAFVSDVRLSVRNLPRDFDEKIVKHMFLSAAGYSDTPGKNRKGESSKPTSNGDPVRIVHCSVVRDADRNERSKGYGFVQFSKHEHALQALHAVNNNPKALEMIIRLKPKALQIDSHRERYLRKQWGERRLMVEFSVEDRRKVQIIERIKEKGKKLSEEHKQRKRDNLAGISVPDVQNHRSEGQKKGSVDRTKKLSKSEKKSVLKRQRADQIEEEEHIAKSRKIPGGTSSPSPKRKQARRYSGDDWDEDPSFSRVDEKSEKPDPKRKKSKKKRSASEMERDNKFDALVDSYKKKLAKTSSAPQWFT